MDIGASVRAIRKRKGITIARICEDTGLSQGFLSQVETGRTSPSIATLESIARALSVPLPYLLLQNDERMNIIRKSERKITASGSENLRVEHLALTRHMRMMMVEVPAGGSTGSEIHAHPGEEIHLVVKGKIWARQGEDEGVFEEGDSFSWNACVPHIVKNVGEETALVLIAVQKDEAEGEDHI
ncbi:MAG: DNA-binding protein [Paenibacillaceae bacterium]|jgi:transcriptional regulator with XRE-family HTH domain|nr:DNA-binding protein [Paenibacillaceae bacterium]